MGEVILLDARWPFDCWQEQDGKEMCWKEQEQGGREEELRECTRGTEGVRDSDEHDFIVCSGL